MTKADIQSREDISVLVNNFYSKVQKDTFIGPFFTEIAKVNWDEHIPKLINFWSDLLLGENNYRGRPFPPHVPLNLELAHFERWLSVFIETVDENFQGPRAEEAKRRGLNIARNFLINIEHIKKS